MKKKERWVIWMPCKGYVRRYLLKNFNKPDEQWAEIVNLKSDKVLQQSFYNHLKRNYTPSVHNSRNYPVTVPIEYTRTAFNRYGWELSDRELLEFNNELEARVKSILYSYVVSMRVLGLSVPDIISRFRRMTGITEDDWQEDAIRKFIQRHVPKGLNRDFEQITKNLEKNLCARLSNVGHITKQGFYNYTDTI